MMARYASYEDFAERIRHKFTNVPEALKEFFSRLVYNILSGNTDDHARNHAAFWDGSMFSLTPAYDICPQGRGGNEATQAMLISGNNRMSRISSCLEAAYHFLLSRVIGKNWGRICEEEKLIKTDRTLFWGRQFLNLFAFDDLDKDAAPVKHLANALRQAKI